VRTYLLQRGQEEEEDQEEVACKSRGYPLDLFSRLTDHQEEEGAEGTEEKDMSSRAVE